MSERTAGVFTRLDRFSHKAKSPWRLSILFAMAVPLFPEYIAPVLAVLSLLTAVIDARRCGRRLKIGPLGWVITAFILYCGIGVLYSPTTLISAGTCLMWAVMFLLYVAMVNVLSDRHRFDAALFVMSVMAGIVGGIACVQYIANALLNFSLPWCVWQRLDDLVYTWFPMPLNLGPGAMRACSTFTNPNILGEYLAMVFPFVVYYAFVGRRTRARLGCRICLLLATGGIAFSFSRGSYLALVTVAVVLCITNANKIMLILLSLSSAVVIIPESVLARLFSIKDTDTDASIGERLDIWKICIEAIGEKPVLGYGPGVQNSWDIIIAGGINAPHAHNLVLQLLIEGGIVGLALMLFLGLRTFFVAVRLARHSPRSQETRMLGILFAAFVLAFCVDSMVEYPFLTPKLIGTFVLVLAMADATRSVYMGETVSHTTLTLRRWAGRLRTHMPGKKARKKTSA